MYTIRLSKAIPKTEYFQYAITFICWLNNEKGSNEIKNHEIEEEEVKNQSLCIICDRFLCVCQCVDCVVQYTIHADTELANKSHDIHRKQFQVFRLLSNKTQEKNQFHRQKCSSTTFVELKKGRHGKNREWNRSCTQQPTERQFQRSRNDLYISRDFWQFSGTCFCQLYLVISLVFGCSDKAQSLYHVMFIATKIRIKFECELVHS